MKIYSKRFKRELEFDDNLVISMPWGLPGFSDSKRFCILELDVEESPFKWFHDIDNTSVALLITDPYMFFPDYNPRIQQSVLEDLKIAKIEEDMMLFTIVKVASGGKSAYSNLRAPVVVNAVTKNARQIILEDDTYSITTELFNIEKKRQVAVG